MPSPAFQTRDPRVAGSFPADALSRRPLYALLVQFPVVCFVGTWVTDVVYWRTALFMWETFAVWLLAFGCLIAGVAGVVGLLHFVFQPRLRAVPGAWPHALFSLAAAVVAVFNAFVHSRDGYTAVVPTGLALSTIVVVLMVLAAWFGRPHPADMRVPTGVAA